MKIFLSNQVKEIDDFTIKQEPIFSIDLMERAGSICTNWIIAKFSKDTNFIVFCGFGNNGGDGLAIARQLADAGYKVKTYILQSGSELQNDPLLNYQRLVKQGKVNIESITKSDELPFIGEEELIIDAIFGSGLSRPVEGFISNVIEHINLKQNKVIAIDIPSGLFGEDNSQVYSNWQNKVVRANYTLALHQPNLSFFLSENQKFIGEFEILPIGLHPKALIDTQTAYSYIELKDIQLLLKLREKFSHKGTFGNGLLMAGSYGMMGACVLAARAAKRSGIGLITCHIPRLGVEIIQTTVPEALLSIDQSDILISESPNLEKYTALALGPGIGIKENTCKSLKAVLEKFKNPIIIDADGLNIISNRKELLDILPEDTILSPHPKEFDRLFGKSENAYDRLMKQIVMSEKHHVYIVLKGAHTSISCPDGKVFFNSTGNPGMATGGSGDVLSGIILSLLAQDYSPKNACLLGVYLHGLAGDIAKAEIGEEALIASDIIDNIGKAFKFIRN